MGLDDEHYMRMAHFDREKEIRRMAKKSTVSRDSATIVPWVFGLIAVSVVMEGFTVSPGHGWLCISGALMAYGLIKRLPAKRLP
jgi:hypothetical protein